MDPAPPLSGHHPLLLTGASRGIGEALALALAGAGCPLVLNARSVEPLEAVARRCEAAGVAARVVAGDCGEDAVVRRMVDEAVALGGVGGFVHNAAVAWAGPLLWELDDRAVRLVLDSNVLAGFHLARHALPRMSGGVAVILGSGAADGNLAGLGPYCVAKAAAEHLARQIAVERPDVLAFVFRPGVVETRMQQQARQAQGGGGQALRQRFQGYQDQGMLTTPAQVARILVDALIARPTALQGATLDARDPRPRARSG